MMTLEEAERRTEAAALMGNQAEIIDAMADEIEESRDREEAFDGMQWEINRLHETQTIRKDLIDRGIGLVSAVLHAESFDLDAAKAAMEAWIQEAQGEIG